MVINKDNLLQDHALLDYFVFEDMIGHRAQLGVDLFNLFRLKLCFALHYHLGDSLTDNFQDLQAFGL